MTEVGGWSINWEGQCRRVPLWFTLYGHHAAHTAEVRVNDWIFTPVRLDQVEGLLLKALSGDAALRRGMAGFGPWRLEIVVGDETIINDDREGSGKPDSEWELKLLQTCANCRTKQRWVGARHRQ
ncbi:hypothetical protein AB0F30_32780 [Streptomyces sp. NPDC029006]|uniref:hypothetical protein n=1 Tax=Streptomyces sp. NPDC029006 TaxID=3155467 RepID=UPI0033C7C6D8